MAKQKTDNTEEVKKIKQYKGTAKQFIKYAGQFIKVGEKFDIEEKDVEELGQYADIEVIEIEVPPESDGDKTGDGEGKKEGE